MNRTALICDDDTHIRCILAAKLRANGWTVHEARDGEEGFATALAERPAVIVSDFQMPGTDGLAMAKRLKADPATRGTPVVMLTARGHAVTDEERGQTNICDLIDKPFSAKQVLACIERVLAGANHGGPSHADAA